MIIVNKNSYPNLKSLRICTTGLQYKTRATVRRLAVNEAGEV
jgi:hypothetical protein